jgi:hypothetical protein
MRKNQMRNNALKNDRGFSLVLLQRKIAINPDRFGDSKRMKDQIERTRMCYLISQKLSI